MGSAACICAIGGDCQKTQPAASPWNARKPVELLVISDSHSAGLFNRGLDAADFALEVDERAMRINSAKRPKSTKLPYLSVAR